MAEATNTTNPSEDGFTPTEAAKMLVAIYGHPRWKPTGLEAQALLVARAFLGHGVALRSIAINTCCDNCQEAALVAQKALGWKNCERCGKNHYDTTRPTVPTCSFKPYGGEVERHLRLYGHLPSLGCCEHDQPEAKDVKP